LLTTLHVITNFTAHIYTSYSSMLPRTKLYIGAFNVRTLYQIGQQASLAMILESRSIDICCISETRIQDPSTVIRLTSPCENKEPARFTLRVSGDPTATTRGLAGVGIALSLKAEQALLDWIPIDSRLCAVRLNGTVRTLNGINCSQPELAWNDIQKAVERAVISTNKLDLKVRKTQWISAASAELIDTRQHIPSGSEHDEQRKQLKHKLIKSLRNDREQWWVAKAKEMEKTAAIGNSRQLFRLIKEISIRNPTVNKT
ncbi:polyprotein, partial [Schistosoma japonicum]